MSLVVINWRLLDEKPGFFRKTGFLSLTLKTNDLLVQPRQPFLRRFYDLTIFYLFCQG